MKSSCDLQQQPTSSHLTTWRRLRPLAACVAAGALAASQVPGYATPGSSPAATDTAPAWGDCPEALPVAANTSASSDDAPVLQCLDVTVPVDHNASDGDNTLTLTVGKVAATDQSAKRGSIIVAKNSAGTGRFTQAAQAATDLGPEITAHYDIITVDSRAFAVDKPLQCFDKSDHQWKQASNIYGSPPVGQGQTTSAIQSSIDYYNQCENRVGHDLTQYSSATWAHDLDAVRAAMGEETINLIASDGHSHSAQVYLNMFPQRVRTAVIDGVTDGHRVAGAGKFQNADVAVRTGQIAAAQRQQQQLHRLCDKAGPSKCLLAEDHSEQPSAAEKLDFVLATAKKSQLMQRITTEYVDDAGKVVRSETELHRAPYNYIVDTLQVRSIMMAGYTRPAPAPAEFDKLVYTWWKAAHGEADFTRQVPVDAPEPEVPEESTILANPFADDAPAWDPDYLRELESAYVHRCNDSRHLTDMTRAAHRAIKTEKLSPVHGQRLSWTYAVCSAWPNTSEADTAGFSAKTTNPVLFVNSKYSKLTDHRLAHRAAKRYPNSAFLTTNAWVDSSSLRHSDCAKKVVLEYLDTAKKPSAKDCAANDPAPFTTELADDAKQLTPID